MPVRRLVAPFALVLSVAAAAAQDPTADFAAVRPLVQKYCLGCHSAKAKKGGLDLERFDAFAAVRKDLKPWQQAVELVEAREMPPKEKPQPTADERMLLLARVRSFLDAEATARAGDPGFVPLRRLSNAEYDSTVRDLTGVDLRPTREFPADGAAGEGFTNAAEALTDVSPALLTKYLNAAKDVADHAVLLPDGIRFSAGKTRRDWTDECVAKLRAEYAAFGPEGRLPLAPYLAATVRHRDELRAGKVEAVAAREKLNAKYLGVLWRALTGAEPSQPLDAVRAKRRAACEKDVPALAAEIAAWQAALWKTVKVGNYVQASWNSPDSYVESLTRQVSVDPQAVASVPLRVAVKPAPGQADVVLYLSTQPAGAGVWQRPRFEAPGKPPLLLRDYAKFGPAHEVDYAAVFADTAKYLAAVAEAPGHSPAELAKRPGLDPEFLARWVELLAARPAGDLTPPLRTIPAGPLTLLEERTPKAGGQPAINGWRKKGTDLPSLVTNASDAVEHIPGTVPPHKVAVHPMPTEYVGVTWTSPVAGTVKVAATITHAHPACGNGIAWRIEHRRDGRADVLGEGVVDLGKRAVATQSVVAAKPGDVLLLVVDARDGNHVCDLTEVAFTVTVATDPAATWDLAADVADTVLAGNPHADTRGNKGVWGFVRGPSIPAGKATGPIIPPGSLLARWRAATGATAAQLAEQARALLTGPRPADEKSPDRALYDHLLAPDGVLLRGLPLSRLGKPRGGAYALPADRFTGEDLVAPAGGVVEVRLPAALFRDRQFVVEGRAGDAAADAALRFTAAVSPPDPHARWDGTSPVVASPTSAAFKRLVAGYAEFRRVFPLYVCFPPVVPTDEVVTLKMFHREDEPFARLFADDAQVRRLDRLWAELRFVSRQPVAEYAYLPQFMGFTTQDTPKPFQQFFVDRKPLFKTHADEFLTDEAAAVPKHLDALLAFAGKAYRRPLAEKEKADLLALYQALRDKGVAHAEAVRGVIARVLVAPAFLFRIEQTPPGKEPGPVSDWELATRLSYFLWSSMPDDELRRLAADGRLRDPAVLAEQTRRMLKDDRARALATEFGAQWLHVRGFEGHNEKNEKLFPTFDATLRAALAEEVVLFFQDLFRSDRPVTAVLDADYTYLNETLAKHYGIPGVGGPQWRRVDGVRKYGRGGVLGLGCVQAKESGASRTSPVLRGNWVVETLLGEKLPRPPANVPKLPEEEGGDGLTVRQQVERHAKDPACATCHVRIDPFGFALEKYDPIGRRRDKDLAGLPIDTRGRAKDGAEFDGIDGLRDYLLTKKKDVIVRLFCRRLLGYALGRSVALSDTALLDEMAAELERGRGVSSAVGAIVRSPQFRTVRGSEFAE